MYPVNICWLGQSESDPSRFILETLKNRNCSRQLCSPPPMHSSGSCSYASQLCSILEVARHDWREKKIACGRARGSFRSSSGRRLRLGYARGVVPLHETTRWLSAYRQRKGIQRQHGPRCANQPMAGCLCHKGVHCDLRSMQRGHSAAQLPGSSLPRQRPRGDSPREGSDRFLRGQRDWDVQDLLRDSLSIHIFMQNGELIVT